MSMLAAIDGEQVPSPVVEVGYELAQQFGEELVVIHVMPEETFDALYDETSDQGSLPLAPPVTYGDQDSQPSGSGSSESRETYTMKDAEDDAMEAARDVVEKTLDKWNNISFQGRVGKPVNKILDEAGQRDTRYLVVGGRKRTPVGKAVFGSKTQSILLNADHPVMTVMQDK